jgi:hypothetical protein
MWSAKYVLASNTDWQFQLQAARQTWKLCLTFAQSTRPRRGKQPLVRILCVPRYRPRRCSTVSCLSLWPHPPSAYSDIFLSTNFVLCFQFHSFRFLSFNTHISITHQMPSLRLLLHYSMSYHFVSVSSSLCLISDMLTSSVYSCKGHTCFNKVITHKFCHISISAMLFNLDHSFHVVHYRLNILKRDLTLPKSNDDIFLPLSGLRRCDALRHDLSNWQMRRHSSIGLTKGIKCKVQRQSGYLKVRIEDSQQTAVTRQPPVNNSRGTVFSE